VCLDCAPSHFAVMLDPDACKEQRPPRFYRPSLHVSSLDPETPSCACESSGRVARAWIPRPKPALISGSVPAPVYFHNPWYTSWGGFKSDDCTRQALEPLLNMYGADLVYNGELNLSPNFKP